VRNAMQEHVFVFATRGTQLALGKRDGGRRLMDLAIWLPVTFLLGLIGLGLCYVFLLGCEKI